MSRLALISLVAYVVMAVAGCGEDVDADKMSFFVTSVRTGTGGNLGGLEGADARCQRLAEGAGSKKRRWHAYLSAAPTGVSPAVNARDRIGTGPWFNAKGVQIAASIEELHGPSNNITAQTALTERGGIMLGGIHDVMTGSNPDGTAAKDATCGNWTSTAGRAVVGHHNRQGSCCGDRARSWNSAHESKGCSLPALQAMGGDARFYCFAAD